jgi:hypothetical protein
MAFCVAQLFGNDLLYVCGEPDSFPEVSPAHPQRLLEVGSAIAASGGAGAVERTMHLEQPWQRAPLPSLAAIGQLVLHTALHDSAAPAKPTDEYDPNFSQRSVAGRVEYIASALPTDNYRWRFKFDDWKSLRRAQIEADRAIKAAAEARYLEDIRAAAAAEAEETERQRLAAGRVLVHLFLLSRLSFLSFFLSFFLSLLLSCFLSFFLSLFLSLFLSFSLSLSLSLSFLFALQRDLCKCGYMKPDQHS